MIVLKEIKLNVLKLADLDGYKGVARYGILHKDFDRLIEVNLETENGWWIDDSEQFLVFYKGESPSVEICMKPITSILCMDYEFTY
jgi:hypothetical protein